MHKTGPPTSAHLMYMDSAIGADTSDIAGRDHIAARATTFLVN